MNIVLLMMANMRAERRKRHLENKEKHFSTFSKTSTTLPI
jgi:hypothetical protein